MKLFLNVISILMAFFISSVALSETISDELLNQLINYNKKEKVLEVWQHLANHGDGYAKTAKKIFSKEVTLEGCVVRANWINIVGPEVKAQKFDIYAQLYQAYYIQFLVEHRRFPNTFEIERMYQMADDDLGLPQSVSVDLLLNLLPKESIRKFFSDALSNLILFGGFSFAKKWYDFTKISKSRISEESIAANNLTPKQADRVMWRTARIAGDCWLRGRGQIIEGY